MAAVILWFSCAAALQEMILILKELQHTNPYTTAEKNSFHSETKLLCRMRV